MNPLSVEGVREAEGVRRCEWRWWDAPQKMSAEGVRCDGGGGGAESVAKLKKNNPCSAQLPRNQIGRALQDALATLGARGGGGGDDGGGGVRRFGAAEGVKRCEWRWRVTPQKWSVEGVRPATAAGVGAQGA